MDETLLTPQQSYALWIGFAATCGVLVFLRLAAKEWGYRMAWLQNNASRKARRAALQVRLARNAEAAAAAQQAMCGFTVPAQPPIAAAGASDP